MAAERPAGRRCSTPPCRTAATDQLEILLVTSRETRRWVIPRGWPMKGKKPYAAAAARRWRRPG